MLQILSMENIKQDQKTSTVESIKGILFVMCCLFAGVVIHFGSKKYHYPYTVGCFLFGVIIGLIEINSTFVQNFTVMTRMDPSDMLLTFLPILIFESSFGVNAHMFYKALPQCLILATIGFIFCSALTAVITKYTFHIYNWSWLTAFLFGSIISATDPVAVIALLKEMKMPHSFTIIIEGESLLNDGIAIVTYELLSHLEESQKSLQFGKTVYDLLKTCIGAPTFGYFVGKITEWILIKIYISPVSEMTITFILAYVSYFVAERILGVSAVLAVVLYGVTLSANRMCISPESESLVNTDWRILAIYANTLIFMFVGILVTVSFSQHFTVIDAWFLFVTYVSQTLLRSAMIILFYPVLKNTGYSINWKECIILSWGGLRGAIGLALALMLASNPSIPSSANVNKVLVQVSGIIVLTLIVNANSLKFIMKLINFKEITLVNRLSMGNAIACVNGIKEKSLQICKNEWKLMKADWEWVIRKTKLEDPYKGGLYGDDPRMCSLFVPYGACNECLTAILPYAPSAEEMDELREAARKKVLRALKGYLWKQFRKGLIQRRTLKLLCVAADDASDYPNLYLKTDVVKASFMKVSRLNHWLETKLYQLRKLKRKQTDFDVEIYCLQKANFKGFRKFCLSIYFSKWFEPLILGVIILNVLHISMDLYFLLKLSSLKYKSIMNYFAAFFIIFYAFEIIIKISALKWKLYKRPFWNKIDFSLSIYAILEGAIDLTLSQFPELHFSVFHIRILITLRFLKHFRTVINLFFTTLLLIRDHASSELYHAYDIGRGFLFATESVLKNINVIVDFGPCVKIPVSVCEKNIKEMLDVLDEFEKQYPAVVLALKSNRAARKILNRIKTVLGRLKKKSLILQEDVCKIKSILFTMTEQVVYAPRARPFISNILNILEEVDWIDSEFAKDINENHIIVTYDTGEVIHEAGSSHESVFIIAKGIVKVIGVKKEQASQIYSKLPNSDSMLFFDKSQTSFYDYLTTSQTIGLLGLLQRSPSVTTVVCEKDCELVQISYSFLNEAVDKFDNLMYSIWRSIAIKISLQVLKKQRLYKDYSDEDIILQLQKAILPDLFNISSWKIPPVVQSMVIIQGRVKNIATQVEFVAPAFIPSTTHHLQFLDDIKRRPPVVLMLLLSPKFRLLSSSRWIAVEEISATYFQHKKKQEKKKL